MVGYNLYLDQERGGHCEGCKWWECDDHADGAASVGQCHQPELVPFDLRVSGHSGCNHYEPAPAGAGTLAAGG
jgi:hypothetical protein